MATEERQEQGYQKLQEANGRKAIGKKCQSYERSYETKDKGGIKAACRIAMSRPELAKARNDLKSNFWAASSQASRQIKRNEVLKLASLVMEDIGPPLPLTQETVEGAAACLKSSGMKSGDQYLNELKLMHVEEGYDMPPWLVRTLSLCKKTLARNKGPTKKAPEAKLEGISEDLWCKQGSDFEGESTLLWLMHRHASGCLEKSINVTYQ